MATNGDSIQNVGKNAIAPFSSGTLAFGSAQYVAAEVAVSWVLRRLLSMPRPLGKIAFIHGLSLPIMGGAAGFAAPAAGYEAPFTDQAIAGVKGIPAVLVAHYIYQVFEQGFTFPSAGMKEYLVTAASKVLSRPVLSTIYGYLPAAGQDALLVLHQLIARQATTSNLASIGK